MILGEEGEEEWEGRKKVIKAQTRREEEMVIVKKMVLKMKKERIR